VTRPLTAEQVARAFHDACLAELDALKPGNVHRFGDDDVGMSVADFEASARVAAPALAAPGHSVGARIRRSVEATIDVKGIDTREAKRDDHLRGPDFFDVANHPTISFASREVRVKEDGELDVTGDLTIRGTTRSVTLHAEPVSEESKDMYGLIRVGTSASTKISRKDFGLVWNVALEAGGVLVSDKVKISLDVSAIKQPA
jgi:hypothetical protein